ncbi:hypothetical protein ACJU26_05590 [Acidithiobacillus sp. M4-SHS-6]|uniref:hypothetical protein n=1 Tax=Acidithiobacillus sp. M4-SHS-6 TaxID=3383024 RepID=UPI0039BE2F1E
MNIFDRRVNRHWHKYLSCSGEDAGLLRETFQERFTRSDPRYPEVIYPPPLFDASFLATISDSAAQVLAILASLPERMFGGNVSKMLDFQCATETSRCLIGLYSNSKDLDFATRFARPDILVCSTGIKIVEMNVSTALGGLGLCDRVMKEWKTSRFHDWLLQAGVITGGPPMMARWGAVLRACVNQPAAGKALRVLVAFVNPSEARSPSPTFWDFAAGVNAQGFQVVTGLLQDLSFNGNDVSFEGQSIDVVYPMFTYAELAKNKVPNKLFEQLRAAVDAGRIDFVGTPATILFDNKCNLELLSAQEYSHHYSAEEWDLLQRVIPRTIRLKEDLIQYAIANQRGLVLKPASSFGGDQITIGSEVSAEKWQKTVEQAGKTSCSYVIQEAVSDLFRYPAAVGMLESTVCVSPMLLKGKSAGILLREIDFKSGTPVISYRFGARGGVGFGVDACEATL